MSGCFAAPGRASPPGELGAPRWSVGERRDRFADLVARVAADPGNPYNLDRYLWVLDEPSPARCAHCEAWFWPGESYDGGPARGRPRRHCSPSCAQQAGWQRHWARRGGERWGSAA